MKNQRKIGVLLSYASEIIKIITSLVYTPIMLRLLGQSEYGLYQLVYSVVSYLSLLSLGFTASYVRFFSRYKARGQEDEISRLNGMFLTVFIVIATIAVVCGSVMTIKIEAIFKNGLTTDEYDTARILMMLMVLNLALTFPNSVFTCITSAHEKFFFQRLLLVLQNLLNPFLTLPLLLMGYGSIAMVVVTTVITIAHLVSNIWFVCFRLHAKFIFKGFDFSLLREIWGFTFFIFLNQIIDQINWSVDRFLLGRMIGTSAVAIYSLGAQINSMYIMLSTSISSVFVPKVNRIVAETNDDRELSVIFNSVGRIQFLVLSLVMTGFIFLGQPFMRFWGGKGYVDSYYVALWLIIPVTVPLIQNLGIEIQRAKNKHKARAVVYFCIAIANIFLSIPLIRQFSSIGAAIGTAVALIVGNILFMNWYYHKHIGLDIPAFWKNILSFIPALILPAITGVAIMKFAHVNNLLQLILWAIVYGIVFSISMWLFGMNESEKGMILNIKNKIIHRRH
ncbi:lipopolysaccharide biosynthesis protein [Oribacterium sp. WCC10]|uniref:lipopolysaccharide biosynthesis protein n=1 Tax=Oribacterium sp. WCC10 TaxID=1855343 RepID=UPI0008EF11E1|nr:oligosaccharide flippase family protein [Oribacterium sp. WCC10]SFG64991.1 Membrane protein involved in the export of O-antigen and teichoic acid [Oribacterium sp. WCC10]